MTYTLDIEVWGDRDITISQESTNLFSLVRVAMETFDSLYGDTPHKGKEEAFLLHVLNRGFEQAHRRFFLGNFCLPDAEEGMDFTGTYTFRVVEQ